MIQDPLKLSGGISMLACSQVRVATQIDHTERRNERGRLSKFVCLRHAKQFQGSIGIAPVQFDRGMNHRQPGCAACMASLMNLQLHAIDITNLDRRLTKLELAEKDKLNGYGDAPGSDVSRLRKPPRKA